MRALVPLLFGACASVTEPFSEVVDADGLLVLRASVERGSVSYEVGDEDVFAVEGVSRGRAASGGVAADREALNTWRLEEQPPQLVFTARSGHRRGSVDVDVVGPPLVDLNIDAEQGSVSVSDAEGTHRIVSGWVQALRLRGSVDITSSSGGVDVEVYPFTDGAVFLTTTGGDVILRLPFGGNYDVEILGDPEFSMFVAELGFVGSVSQPGYFSGVVGDGSLPVRITAQGGSVQILQAL